MGHRGSEEVRWTPLDSVLSFNLPITHPLLFVFIKKQNKQTNKKPTKQQLQKKKKKLFQQVRTNVI